MDEAVPRGPILILGNHANLTSIGEIYHLLSRGWTAVEEAGCACGELVKECDYWEEVRRLRINSVGESGVERYIEYQERWVQYRPLMKFKMLCSIRQRIHPSAERIDYIKMTIELYRVFYQMSGKPCIVDASKNPLRAYALMLGQKICPDIKLYLLRVVRDSRGVIWSKLQSRKLEAYRGVTVPRFFFSRTSLYWAFKK